VDRKPIDEQKREFVFFGTASPKGRERGGPLILAVPLAPLLLNHSYRRRGPREAPAPRRAGDTSLPD